MRINAFSVVEYSNGGKITSFGKEREMFFLLSLIRNFVGIGA